MVHGGGGSIEVERKFRVSVDPSDIADRFEPLAAWEIWQAYLTPPEAEVEVRVRRALRLDVSKLREFHPPADLDDAGGEQVQELIGIKAPIQTAEAAGLSRHEHESETAPGFFAGAWGLCGGRRLRKVRTEHLITGTSFEARIVVVDRFQDRLEGLVLAEVEFASWAASKAFEPFDFLGPEVTHDPAYRNVALAGRPDMPS